MSAEGIDGGPGEGEKSKCFAMKDESWSMVEWRAG